MPASETVVPPTLPSIHLEPGSEPGTGTSSQADLIRTRPEDEAPADVDMEIGRHGAETLNERVRRVEAQLESLLTVGLHYTERLTDSPGFAQWFRTDYAPRTPFPPQNLHVRCLALPKVTELSKWGALTLRRNTEVLTQGPQNICTAKITSISQLAVTRPTRTVFPAVFPMHLPLLACRRPRTVTLRRHNDRAAGGDLEHVHMQDACPGALTRGVHSMSALQAADGMRGSVCRARQHRSCKPDQALRRVFIEEKSATHISNRGKFVQCQQLGTEERALNTTIGGLADPEGVHARERRRKRIPDRDALPPFRTRPISTRRPPASGPQPAPRQAAHYVDAQSPPRPARSTRVHSMMRCAVAPGGRRRVRGKEDRRAGLAPPPPSAHHRRHKIDHATYGTRYDSRGGPSQAACAGMPKPSSDIPYGAPQMTARRIQRRARGSSTAASDSCTIRTTPASEGARSERGRGDARRTGAAGQVDTCRRERSAGTDIPPRSRSAAGYAPPGPAPEVPIAWGCHITDARRGTPSASAGREGTDGALAEWAAGENESSTKKTHLKSPICNSCSRGSSIRARRRAGAGEDETEARALDQAHGVWERQNGIAWGTAVHGGFSGGGQVEETVSPNARTAPTPSTRARGAAPSPHSSSAADASAGNDEDGGGDGCADDEGENLVAALCAVILLEKVQMSHFFISVSQLRELWLKSGTTRSPAAPGPDP
ncbi:hypothetical protein FB451DRAFT_1190387 [Mycena latifolia]|nr:hypothetical protein FB451DRAFT_1190387 [Mycena latifolia]